MDPWISYKVVIPQITLMHKNTPALAPFLVCRTQNLSITPYISNEDKFTASGELEPTVGSSVCLEFKLHLVTLQPLQQTLVANSSQKSVVVQL